MNRALFAYCGRSGQIQFDHKVPDGFFELARGQGNVVRKVIEETAQLAGDNKTLLVPGMPEAEDDYAAVLKACHYIRRLETHNKPGFRASY